MSQLVVIALGGASGAVLRYLMSTGLYQWLGRDFPYATLAINVLGSFLMGLLTESLILQRISIGVEYRAALLVGFLGAFTTFSTFSLETLNLLEQGHLSRASINIVSSVGGCLLAVWLGLLLGRVLFVYSGGVISWQGGILPIGLLLVNTLCAFIIGVVSAIVLQKVPMASEFRAVLIVVIVGIYLTLSGLYLLLFLLEQGYAFNRHLPLMIGVFVSNSLLCVTVIGLTLLAIQQRLT